jgi:Polyketide cyclase / dehydrase and lipid transport
MDLLMQHEMGVPADRAWDVVGRHFADIAGWAAPILGSSLDAPAPAVGATRTCHILGVGPFPAGVVREQLLHYDDAARSLHYQAVDGMPGFVTRAVNRWTVVPLAADRCAVRVHATLTLSRPVRWLAPVLRIRMRGESRAVLTDLEHVLLTGRPHPRKEPARAPGTGPGEGAAAPTVRG